MATRTVRVKIIDFDTKDEIQGVTGKVLAVTQVTDASGDMSIMVLDTPDFLTCKKPGYTNAYVVLGRDKDYFLLVELKRKPNICDFTVIVKDKTTGLALPNATVTITAPDDGPKNTDINGKAVFSLTRSTNYTIKVSKLGYAPISNASLTPNAATGFIELKIDKIGAGSDECGVYWKVTNSLGQKLDGATVVADKDDIVPKTTGNSATVLLYLKKSKTYQITVSKAGYITETTTYTTPNAPSITGPGTSLFVQ